MYTPQKYMTLEVVEEVVAKFDWPVAYELEDDLPDGVILVFPSCHLLIAEGFESDVTIKFPSDETGLPTSLTMQEALLGLKTIGFATATPPSLPLINDRSPYGSLTKVKNELHDQCLIVLTHFRSCLQGDFSWVESYKAYRAKLSATT